MSRTKKALVVAVAGAVITYGALIARLLREGETLGAVAVFGLFVLVAGMLALMYVCSKDGRW